MATLTTMFWAYINATVVFNAISAIGKTYADPLNSYNILKLIWWIASTMAVWESETKDTLNQKLKFAEVVNKLFDQFCQAFLFAFTISTLPHIMPFDKSTVSSLLTVIDGSCGLVANVLIFRQLN